ncbi:MAG TPA: response regulator transcription factor [Myxococcales bacterium]|jgi:two-component system, NarL family, response regulator NreC|nr:response regulator transcription factor [Myxococcales bacterium]
MTTLRVALVDDHLLFREGLRAMLASAKDLEIVAEASNAQEALPAVRASQPEVVVLDVMLPGISGIGVARELLREDPNRRVLALSMVADEAHVADALQAGVLGYACKSQSAAEVMDAIRTVARGETYLAPQVSGFVVSDYRRLRNGTEGARSPLATLTAREREIFELCIQGNPTAQIARQLCISPRTVETHRGRILRKLNAHSAVDLVRLAARWGLLAQ